MAVSDRDVQRFMCALYPTRLERAASWTVGRLYRVAEHGPVGWLGDRLDDVRVASLRWRADRKLRET